MTTATLSLDEDGGVPSDIILDGLARLHPLAFIANPHGELLWLSDRLARACGGSSRFLGRSVCSLLPGLRLPEAPDATPNLSVLGRSHGLQVGGVGLGSPPLRVDASLVHLHVRQGGPATLLGILRTEQSAPRAQHAADYLTAILDSAPDGVIAVDRSGFVTYANRTFAELTGHPVRDLLDRPAVSFIPSTEQFERVLAVVQSGGLLDGEEIELQQTEGTSVFVSVSGNRIALPEGQSAGTVCFMRDVTDRRRIRRELERKNAELESYVHTVSHDLRSPLVSLLGFSRLLRDDYGSALDETGLHFIDRIEQSGRTMEALIHDLLELSRIGRPGEHQALVDPRAVLMQLQAELKLRLDEQETELVIPRSPTLLRYDRTRLYQVLSNLIGNALDHMGACERARIEVDIVSEPTAHRITVSDNGRGIAPEDHERIFEVFTSLGRKNERRRKSTGIGLAIVRKIAETHGGRVWVESTPGRGTHFHFTIPYA